MRDAARGELGPKEAVSLGVRHQEPVLGLGRLHDVLHEPVRQIEVARGKAVRRILTSSS